MTIRSSIPLLVWPAHWFFVVRMLSACIKHIISPSQTYVRRGHGEEKVESKILYHDDGSEIPWNPGLLLLLLHGGGKTFNSAMRLNFSVFLPPSEHRPARC